MFLGIYFSLSCPICWCIILKQVPESESLYYFCMKRFLCQLTMQLSWLEHGGNNTKDVGSVPIRATARFLLLTNWIFQILKDDAVKVLHSICQQIWKTQQWPQDWKRSVFILMPKNAQTTATGLEKVSFHSNPKERQCQRMLKLPHNCTHLTR